MLKHLVRKTIQSLPEYVPGKSIESIESAGLVSGVIKLASNENPRGPAVQDFGLLESAFTQYYPDVSRAPILSKLATKFGVSVENIILGNGSDDVIQMLCLAFLNAGDEVLTSDCTFSVYERCARIMDATVVKVPLKDNVYDLAGLLAKVSSSTKLIFLANPNNPTGTIVTHEALEKFLAALPQSLVVVLDEAYSDYVHSADFPDSVSLIQRFENLITLRTFSKIYGLAGLRIGYGIGGSELVAILHQVRQPFNINSLAMKAAELALDCQEFVTESIKLNEEGKRYLYKELQSLGLSYTPTESNFIYIDLAKPAQDVFEALLKLGIIIRPLNSFGRPNAIRVTVGTMPENRAFIAALNKV